MERRGLGFGSALDMWLEVEDDDGFDRLDADPKYRLCRLASDYWSFERRYGSKLALFTAAELREIVAGNGPESAPWPAR